MIKTIENDKLSISFNTDTLSITSLKNKISGDEYIKGENNAEILALTCLDGSNNLVGVVPEKVREAEISRSYSKQYLEISFDINGINADAMLILGDEDNKIEWSVDIRNHSDMEIVEVLYPRIRGISLGDTYKDDIIVYPHHGGEKTKNPVEEYLRPCFTKLSRANTKKEGDLHYREINYCGLASMMWMYYYDSENGFYISSYDNEFFLTGLRVETGGPQDPWMGFAIRKYHRIKKEERWRSKPYITAVNCYDWHWGAKEYRRWIDQHIKMPQNPKYLDNEYTVMNMYKFRREGQVYYRFEDIPELFDIAKSYGINHFFMAGWNRKGFDQNYPEYYPDLELGTSMDLYNGVDYINNKGGVPTFYINARIFDIYSDYFETMGKRLAVKLNDGKMINEQYGEYKFTVSCPGNKEWQKMIIDTAYWMVKSYKAKGIYLDQLGSAEPYPCYDGNHSHEDIGLFNQGYLSVLKTLKDSLRELDKDTFLMIENCGDIYGSYIWGSLTWNGEIRDEYFNLFKYTFPEYVQVNMINPKITDDQEFRVTQYYKDVERALTLGSVLWANPVVKYHAGDEELLDYLRKAIEFRKQINPYVMNSTFLDDEGISFISDGIKVTRWKGGGAEELYIIGNNEGTGGYFDLPYELADIKVYSIERGYIEPEWEKTDKGIRIIVPQGRVSFAIVKPLESHEAVDAFNN